MLVAVLCVFLLVFIIVFGFFFCFCFVSYCIISDYGLRINLDFFFICFNCNLMDVESDIGTIFKSVWRFNEVKIFCDV